MRPRPYLLPFPNPVYTSLQIPTDILFWVGHLVQVAVMGSLIEEVVSMRRDHVRGM